MSAELLQRYRCDRDRRDYERLVEMHRPLVASVCRRLLRDPNDVDDVVQETFLKLAGSLDTVSGSLAGWLVATARAASVDLIRREVRERNRRCGLGQLGSQQVEHLATREAIRLRLHDAILAIEPAAREVLIERFLRRTPLGMLAVQLQVSVPTAHRRVAEALRQLAQALREMGIVTADDHEVAVHFGQAAARDDPDESDHGELRFAPDWRCSELTPLGETAPTMLLPSWSRPMRVGVLISYQSTRVQFSNRTYVGTKWQVHSAAFLPAMGLQLVAVVEPGTVHRGIVEGTLRDYGIVGGLIEADDETALATLDVLLLGINSSMPASVARAINRAVRGGVGLLNEFWTANQLSRDDPAGVRELMLADSDVFKYHMPSGECGVAPLPATVRGEHPLLPGLKTGTQIAVRGCGPAYRVMPGAQVLLTKDHVVQPMEHGMSEIGALQMPCYILGQLGRGRVAVIHAWPHQWFTRHLSVGSEQYYLNLLRWLAGSREDIS